VFNNSQIWPHPGTKGDFSEGNSQKIAQQSPKTE
jgi:hypothetical protein